MKIIITFILITMMCICTTGFTSNPTINEILNRPSNTNNKSVEIINSILNKNKTEEIRIYKQEDIKSNEFKKESNTNDDKDKDIYIKGLDISKWNGVIDWDAVEKAGIKFVIIRAGYGQNANSDKMFKHNIEEAINHKMIIGIYWFSYAYTDQMAVIEARKCIETIAPYKERISLPIFYDFEYDSVRRASNNGVHINKQLASSFADAFCTEMQRNNYRAGIYTNIDYARRYFNKDVLNKYHLWIAQWASSCTYKETYILWQRTDKYYIDNRKFDLNYYYYNRDNGDVK